MKRLCGFAVSHIVTHYYATSHRVAWSVGLSVALSVCHTSEPCKNGWNNQVAIWVQDSVGPNEPRITWGPDANMGRGNFEGKWANHCKVQGHSVVICANTAEPIEVPFGLWTRVGRRMHKSVVFARWRQCVLVGGHVAVTCRITLNHTSTAAMRLRSNYFDHLLSLDMPT